MTPYLPFPLSPSLLDGHFSTEVTVSDVEHSEFI